MGGAESAALAGLPADGRELPRAAGGARGTNPTGDAKPTPNEGLPPRIARTKAYWTATREPEPEGKRNATEVKACYAALEPKPTHAQRHDQSLPTPGGPTEKSHISHAFVFEKYEIFR